MTEKTKISEIIALCEKALSDPHARPAQKNGLKFTILKFYPEDQKEDAHRCAAMIKTFTTINSRISKDLIDGKWAVLIRKGEQRKMYSDLFPKRREGITA
ncbi:MAG: hypothetical protein M0Q91_12610 [Methanoregula sp.]|nr:hypothetical protein [Methanoregula sp.]